MFCVMFVSLLYGIRLFSSWN